MFGYLITQPVANDGLNPNLITPDFRLYHHFSLCIGNKRSGYGVAPMLKTNGVLNNQLHLSVQTRSGIPARRKRLIFQTNCHRIHISRFQKFADIEKEITITIRTVTHPGTIHIHNGITHSPIKGEQHLFTRLVIAHIQLRTIPTYPNKRQSTRTSGFLGRFLFVVLHNFHHLLINFFVEGTVNRPVVRHHHLLPLTIVEQSLRCIAIIIAAKPPRLHRTNTTRLRY